MLRSLAFSCGMGLLLMAAACETGRHASAGFRLPAYGDVERGKATFVALQCNTCHEVAGTDLPRPTAQPAVPFVLGGLVTREVSDGYLVTSIINPSHTIAGRPKEMVAVGDKSRMPEYGDNITVRQLTDVVAFLQSRYTFRRPMGDYPAHL